VQHGHATASAVYIRAGSRRQSSQTPRIKPRR
jgi:hypothetical protein